MNGILCRKSRTEYCDYMSTYLSPGILKIKWVHPRYMYVSVRLQLTEDGERRGNGGLSGFLVLYPSIFNIPLLSSKEIRRGIWPNHHKCSSNFRDYEKSDWIISWSFREKWKLVYPENCNKAQCGINIECKIELRIVQPTVSGRQIHS